MEWVYRLLPSFITFIGTVLFTVGYYRRRIEDLETRTAKIEGHRIGESFQRITSEMKSLDEKFCEIQKTQKETSEKISDQTMLLGEVRTNINLIMKNMKITIEP